MYQLMDKKLEKLKKHIKKKRLYYDSIGIDELNRQSVPMTTYTLMKELKAINEKDFIQLGATAYRDATKVAKKKGFNVSKENIKDNKEKKIDRLWILSLLGVHNVVTNYIYDQEAERKRLKLEETMFKLVLDSNRTTYSKDVKKFFNYWYSQSAQYMIDVVDSAETEAFKDAGVEYARWVTAEDERVCVDCRNLDGKIFRLDAFPSKPHYRCRCRKEPVNYAEMIAKGEYL